MKMLRKKMGKLGPKARDRTQRVNFLGQMTKMRSWQRSRRRKRRERRTSGKSNAEF